MKKITIVGQENLFHSIGGSAAVFFDLCDFLSNEYKINAICYPSEIHTNVDEIPYLIRMRQGNEEFCKNVNIINLRASYSDATFSKAINQFLKDNTADLIIFFFPNLMEKGKLEYIFDDIPKILMFHFRPDAYRKANRIEKYYKNTISQVLFPSYYDLLPKFIKAHPVVAIPNYITAPAEQKSIDYTLERRKIVYLSRVDCMKGLEFLLKSFALIAKKYPKWQIDIWGQSEPLDYVIKLEKLAKRLGISNQIHFKGLSKTPLKTLLDYDFGVFPSIFEGMSLGLLEMQSVGLACVGLKGSSGVNEQIIDSENGFLAEYNHKDFAQKIELLIQNPALREELGKNAVLSSKAYDKSKIQQTWSKLIKDILNGKSPNVSFEYPNKNNKYKLFSLRWENKKQRFRKTFYKIMNKILPSKY